ncbi:MAG: hypothetical protein QOJ89_619 [bacterium]|jgi:hypothetical protein
MLGIRSLPATALAIVATACLACLASAAGALAAQAPTILTAGVDANDHLYVTWSLAAGTSFERAVFATTPQPHPFLAGFFADENLGTSDCAGEPGCLGTATTTSYVTRRPVKRDRRFFAEVTAVAGLQLLTSAVWVIDEDRPLVVADGLYGDPRRPSNSPAGGRLFAPAPSASLKLLKLPATISAVLSSAVRVRVGCSASCDVDLRLSLDGQTLARRTGRLPAEAAEKLVLRPTGAARAILRVHSRARLRVTGSVTPLGGPTRRIARTFSVRR